MSSRVTRSSARLSANKITSVSNSSPLLSNDSPPLSTSIKLSKSAIKSTHKKLNSPPASRPISSRKRKTVTSYCESSRSTGSDSLQKDYHTSFGISPSEPSTTDLSYSAPDTSGSSITPTSPNTISSCRMVKRRKLNPFHSSNLHTLRQSPLIDKVTPNITSVMSDSAAFSESPEPQQFSSSSKRCTMREKDHKLSRANMRSPTTLRSRKSYRRRESENDIMASSQPKRSLRDNFEDDGLLEHDKNMTVNVSIGRGDWRDDQGRVAHSDSYSNDPHEVFDEEFEAQEISGHDESSLGLFTGMTAGGISHRISSIVNQIRHGADGTMQLIALQELSELLLVSGDDSVIGHLSMDSLIKKLVRLMQSDEFDTENSEIILLACRCICNLMEVSPAATAQVVYAGAVGILCQKLLEIHFIDLAEQALSTLEKISLEFPEIIVREGGLTACLSYLDFFASSTQRTAVTTAANCCRDIPEDCFDVVRQVMPVLQNVLSSADQRVLEQGCICVSRIIESFRNEDEKLEELVCDELLKKILDLIVPGRRNTLGANIHAQLLRVLSAIARASSRCAAELLKLNVVDRLFQILTGRDEEGKVLSTVDVLDDDFWRRDDIAVMETIIQRPREQIGETLNVICDLLPHVNGKCLSFIKELEVVGFSSGKISLLVGDKGKVKGRARPDSEKREVECEEEHSGMVKRLEYFEECKEEVKQFVITLFPILTYVYSSTVNLNVRRKVLTAQIKMLSNLDKSILEEAIDKANYGTFLRGIFLQKDHDSLIPFGLQLAELVLKRLGDKYRSEFYRTGVMEEIERTSNREIENPENLEYFEKLFEETDGEIWDSTDMSEDGYESVHVNESDSEDGNDVSSNEIAQEVCDMELDVGNSQASDEEDVIRHDDEDVDEFEELDSSFGSDISNDELYVDDEGGHDGDDIVTEENLDVSQPFDGDDIVEDYDDEDDNDVGVDDSDVQSCISDVISSVPLNCIRDILTQAARKYMQAYGSGKFRHESMKELQFTTELKDQDELPHHHHYNNIDYNFNENDSILNQLTRLAKEISQFSKFTKPNSPNWKKYFEDLALFFDGETKGGVACYELTSSNLVSTLLNVFTRELSGVKLIHCFRKVFMKNPRIMTNFIRTLQESLSCTESFQIVKIQDPQNPTMGLNGFRGNDPGIMSKQIKLCFKLRLDSDNQTNELEMDKIIIPKMFHNFKVSVKSFTMFNVVEEYFKSRIMMMLTMKRKMEKLSGMINKVQNSISHTTQARGESEDKMSTELSCDKNSKAKIKFKTKGLPDAEIFLDEMSRENGKKKLSFMIKTGSKNDYILHELASSKSRRKGVKSSNKCNSKASLKGGGSSLTSNHDGKPKKLSTPHSSSTSISSSSASPSPSPSTSTSSSTSLSRLNSAAMIISNNLSGRRARIRRTLENPSSSTKMINSSSKSSKSRAHTRSQLRKSSSKLRSIERRLNLLNNSTDDRDPGNTVDDNSAGIDMKFRAINSLILENMGWDDGQGSSESREHHNHLPKSLPAETVSFLNKQGESSRSKSKSKAKSRANYDFDPELDQSHLSSNSITLDSNQDSLNLSFPANNTSSTSTSACSSDRKDFNLEFFINETEPIPSNSIIIGAIFQSLKSSSNSENTLDLASVWNSTHTIHFRPVAASSPTDHGPSMDNLSSSFGFACSRCAETSETVPQSSSSKSSGLNSTWWKDFCRDDPNTSDVLQLLSILHNTNSQIEDDSLSNDGGLEVAPLLTSKLHHIPLLSFLNTKLTAKFYRQLQEQILIISNSLPIWTTDLIKHFPFLFPFHMRLLFLQSTNFGYARSMHRWLSTYSPPPSDSRIDPLRDERLLLGRLPRQKISISRSHIFDSALKLLDLYSSVPAVLEIEYNDEVGTGLGPTMEFYSLVSREFCRRKLELWRDNAFQSENLDSDQNPDHLGDSQGFVNCQSGLFPAPMSEDMAHTEKGKRIIRLFTLLGKFVARALLDSRLIDLPIHPLFFRIAFHDLPSAPTVSTVRLVDHNLARSISILQQYIDGKNQIIATPNLTPLRKRQLIENLTVDGLLVDDLALDFTLPGYPNFELLPNAANVPVTIDNLDLFIDLLISATVASGVHRQVLAFRNGFSQVYSFDSMRVFTSDELAGLVGSYSSDNSDNKRENEQWTIPVLADAIQADHGYTLESRSVRNLLQILTEYTVRERRAFLQFMTGSPRLPVGGFKGLKPTFTVVCKPSEPPFSSDDHLPSVMTCANYLKLPDYSTIDIMRAKLNLAIREGQCAFHLS